MPPPRAVAASYLATIGARARHSPPGPSLASVVGCNKRFPFCWQERYFPKWKRALFIICAEVPILLLLLLGIMMMACACRGHRQGTHMEDEGGV